MSELGELIARQQLDRDEIWHQLPARGRYNPILKRFRETLMVRDVHTIVKTRAINDSFILGHPINGILGSTSIRLGDFRSDWQIVRVVHPDNTYIEKFYDDIFKDEGNTTANWDTSSHKLMFGSTDQTAQSIVVYTDNKTIVAATVNVEYNGTGSFTVYLSADNGANWEEVTLGERHIFNNTGQKLKWRIVGSNVEITSLTIQYEVGG